MFSQTHDSCTMCSAQFVLWKLASNPVTLSEACDPLLSPAFCTPLKQTTWKLLSLSPVSTKARWVDHKGSALPTF